MVTSHRHVVSLLRGQCQIGGVVVGLAFQKGSHFRKCMSAIFHYNNMDVKTKQFNLSTVYWYFFNY